MIPLPKTIGRKDILSTTAHHLLVWFEPIILRCGPIGVQDYQLYPNTQESHKQVCDTSVKMFDNTTLYAEKKWKWHRKDAIPKMKLINQIYIQA